MRSSGSVALSHNKQGNHFPCTSPGNDLMTLYFQDMTRFSPLSAEEEYTLAVAAQSGDQDAKHQLIEGNVRLVVHIAKRYQGQHLDLEDLVQEGNLGLIHAVERYDPAKGFRFSTYAVWWIKQAISRALVNTERTIRFPVYIETQVHRLLSLANRFFEEEGHAPTSAQLAERSGLSPAWIEHLLLLEQPVLSLDQPISARTETTLGETLADPRLPLPADLLVAQADHAALPKRLRATLASCLTEREALIITLCFGLDNDGIERTQAEVGRMLGLSRERIRQLSSQAFVKLRRAFHVAGDKPQTQAS